MRRVESKHCFHTKNKILMFICDLCFSYYYFKKQLAVTSIVWGLRIELIDMEMKDLNKRLKPSFTSKFMNSINNPQFQLNIANWVFVAPQVNL